MTSNIYKYLRQVSKTLYCKSDERVAILVKLQHDMEAYVAAQPRRKPCDAIVFFGDPEDVAKRYMQYLPECVEYERLYFQVTSA